MQKLNYSSLLAFIIQPAEPEGIKLDLGADKVHDQFHSDIEF